MAVLANNNSGMYSSIAQFPVDGELGMDAVKEHLGREQDPLPLAAHQQMKDHGGRCQGKEIQEYRCA